MGRWYPLVSLTGVFVLAVITSAVVATPSGAAGGRSIVVGPFSGVPAVAAFVLVTAVAFTVSLAPFTVSRPRRPRTIVRQTTARVAVVSLGLVVLSVPTAAAGPDPTVFLVTGAILAFILPGWLVLLGRRSGDDRILVATTDPLLAGEVIEALSERPLGFVSPPMHVEPAPTATDRNGSPSERDGRAMADGDGAQPESDSIDRALHDGGRRPARATSGSANDTPVRSHTRGTTDAELPAPIETGPLDGVESIAGVRRLGGFTRQADLFSTHDVDTVALAIRDPDRGEFFGTLECCREHGVEALVPASHAANVLVAEEVDGGLCRVDLRPWSWYSRVGKRAFDLAFAAIGLMVLTPFILVIAAAIKLDSPGPVFYEQPRTSAFGRHFRLLKFRTMFPDSADASPVDDGTNDRITRVGHLLRTTHLDEIPQLGSILVGDMSVVGPRAVWTEEERILERSVAGWRTRWLVKPGLTGLAQIRGVTSTDGEKKLENDLEYVANRTFLYDLKIVLAQIRIVLTDTLSLAIGDDGGQC